MPTKKTSTKAKPEAPKMKVKDLKPKKDPKGGSSKKSGKQYLA